MIIRRIIYNLDINKLGRDVGLLAYPDVKEETQGG